jgi:hypothetical protein
MSTVLSVLAVDVSTLRTSAIVAIVVLVLLGLLAMKLFVNMVVRVITLVLVVGFSVAIWTQRDTLQECADRVKDLAELDVSDVARGSLTCTFFGVQVNVPIPRGVN